ncbi:acetate--CoA ligase [Paenibacillus abyssi]|uniref:acetate--CoA ligase n=1 Tax=Paenibacillus abyssi TaxID=1340531 RepID=A0A917D232_9BACL|nr:acetate--CoA ligase [Paenibacillus abyssi]GGG03753.1 acetyl-coenzyme A synthetase [Paenibacillus abyssi]
MEKLEIKESLPPGGGKHNLNDYESVYETFRFEEVFADFSWHTTGKVNMAHELIDRHVMGPKKDKTALIYVDDNRRETYTFDDLRRLSGQFGNLLLKLGVKKGDRVFFFMPRSPEIYVGMLGALKIGAIVGPLFEAFMESAVTDRLADAEASVLVTTSVLKGRVPREKLPKLRHLIIVDEQPDYAEGEVDFARAMAESKEELEPAWGTLEDPMILHYTSGSTGKPKGVLHVQGAMIQQYITGKWVLDLQEDDIYWCTADPGWVTGTSYGIFAPWLNGATNLVRGGRFSADGWYRTLQDEHVTVWYSAPTAFRMLMSAGDGMTDKYDFSSLRHVLSVGEPLNPEVIRWGFKAYGKRIHDTWWMTETGAHMIVNLPCMDIRPGSMGKPFPGIVAAIVDNMGNELPPYSLGNLAIKTGWPSMMRQIWNNPAKYQEYFAVPGWYVSGDSAYMDEDGYFWFQGRVDDVINTSGERVGPFEVESKLVEHSAVAEAGVIGKPDPVRGEIIKAFISLREGYTASEALMEEIRLFVKTGLSAHAAPREIEVLEKLPKTRSGKIMRRVLKAQELGLPVGDLSTIED